MVWCSNAKNRLDGFAEIAAMFTKVPKLRTFAPLVLILEVITKWKPLIIEQSTVSLMPNRNSVNRQILKGENYG